MTVAGADGAPATVVAAAVAEQPIAGPDCACSAAAVAAVAAAGGAGPPRPAWRCSGAGPAGGGAAATWARDCWADCPTGSWDCGPGS